MTKKNREKEASIEAATQAVKKEITTQAKKQETTTEKKKEAEILTAYEEEYGKDFCAFVYESVIRKKETCSEYYHTNNGDYYEFKDAFGHISKSYDAFGIIDNSTVVLRYKDYTHYNIETKYMALYYYPEAHNGLKSEIFSEINLYVVWYDLSEIEDFATN